MPKAERPLAAAIEFRNTGMREALEEAERNRYSALDEREEEEQTEREEYRTNELYWARLTLAHGGDPQAQCDIGLCFAKGEHGFSQDDEEAVAWFLRAAEQGHKVVSGLRLSFTLFGVTNLIPTKTSVVCVAMKAGGLILRYESPKKN